MWDPSAILLFNHSIAYLIHKKRMRSITIVLVLVVVLVAVVVLLLILLSFFKDNSLSKTGAMVQSGLRWSKICIFFGSAELSKIF